MADRKISDLTALTTPASGDYLPIVDISEVAAASKNKRITIQSLFQGIPVNVGIGTSSPDTRLHVADGQIKVANSGAINSTIIFTGNGAGASGFQIGQRYNAQELFIYDTAALADRVLVDSSGRVGIGTSSPSQILSVVGNIQLGATLGGGVNGTAYSILGNGATTGNANGGDIEVAAGAGSGSGTNGDIAIAAGSTVSPGSVTTGGSVFITSGKPSDAQTGGTINFRYYSGNPSTVATAMRIDSSGRVGIGTTSPGSLLHLADAGDITVGTTTGTKIGTATTQKIGFFDATPVVQPAAVANITTTATAGALPTPDGAVTIANTATPTVTELLEYCVELEAKLEDLLGKLRTVGIIAT
jgi:hypothetical protein